MHSRGDAVSRKAFRLGGLFGGRLFLYELGEYASHDAALRYYDSLPRWDSDAKRVVTVETVSRVSRGVEYGHDYVVRERSGRVLDI